MKLIPLALAVALAAVATSALSQAVCSGQPLTKAQIDAIVTGNTVCGRPGASYPGGAASSDRWQEEHMANLQLWDYKLGPGHAIDPRKQVGTWSTAAAIRSDPDSITHAYSPTVAFTWLMFGPVTNVPGTSVYLFCTPPPRVEHVRAFVRIGGVACATYPP